jgi:hypothetical protein
VDAALTVEAPPGAAVAAKEQPRPATIASTTISVLRNRGRLDCIKVSFPLSIILLFLPYEATTFSIRQLMFH